jgi:Flp pilus assembly protein TadB
MEFVLAVAIAVGAAAFGHAALRFARTVRRESDEEWRAQWKALDPQRRKAITKAMRRGEAIREPADAELALHAIAQVEMTSRAMRPIELIAWPMLVIVFAFAVVSVSVSTVLVLGFCVVLTFFAVGTLASEWQQRRLRQSAEATRRLR